MMGSGTSFIGDTKIEWDLGDMFVGPTWNWIEHRAKEDTILFTMTDEYLMRFQTIIVWKKVISRRQIKKLSNYFMI